MTNILITFGYDGTVYRGFQLQEKGPTVQGEVERALKIIYGRPLRLHGSGRTDAGVHARGQAANFMAPFKMPLERIPYALNAVLPPDIVVTLAREVASDFNARFQARLKEYSYSIDRGRFPQALKRLYRWHLPGPLDTGLLEEAAALFEGTHDFKRFRAAGSDVRDTVRTLYRVSVEECGAEELLVFRFTGSGFLYRMARLITGALIRAGRGRLSLKEIEAALKGADNGAAGPSAPAHGLCLEKVVY